MGPHPHVEDVVSFESLGIADEFMEEMFPKIAGKYSGGLLLCGSGRCVWDDIEKAGMAKNTDMDVMCVNNMVEHYPGPVEHGYSNDAQLLSRSCQNRRPNWIKLWGPVRHQHSVKSGGKWTWPFPGHGTSSLNAVYIGLALGYDRIWLCGIPLDNSGHYFDAPWVKTNFNNEVAPRHNGPRYWDNAAKRIFKGKVKSFSGRTRDLLGEPDR